MSDTTIALAGNPNSGKTTLFNLLTGARQHVGNYPGVTVEKKTGAIDLDNTRVAVVDLPGTYSLSAYSLEEVVARDYLLQDKPQLVVNIVDASNLERNLYLTLQLMELGLPICIALNMMDVAGANGVEVNIDKLSSVLGVPVVPIVARQGQGKAELLQAVAQQLKNRPQEPSEEGSFTVSYGSDVDLTLKKMQKAIAQRGFLTETYPARWTALKYLEGDSHIQQLGQETDPDLSTLLEKQVAQLSAHLEVSLNTYPEAVISDQRYGAISAMARQGVVTYQNSIDRLVVSDVIDRVVTHRIAGPVIMLAALLAIYQFTFTVSEVPVGLLESLFGWLEGAVAGLLGNGQLSSLISSGIIGGVGGVLGFVPLIMLMFFAIALLEDSGYLARVAYMLDRIFRLFGLHGSAVMAFVVSGGIAGGCAVPGVMAARTLRSPRERLATLLTVPFMNCGAKLPVFALLVGAFFAEYKAWVMLGITLVAWSGALLVARLLRSTIIAGPSTPFVMELPPYRVPTLKGLLIHTWERTWQYIRKAGTVILGISIVLWAMMTFPGLPESKSAEFAKQRQQLEQAATPSVLAEKQSKTTQLSPPAALLQQQLQSLHAQQAQAALRYSAMGRMGTAIEGVSSLAGFDWRTNIALVGGFAAKEVIVSTLGIAYSLGDVDPEQATPLSVKLASLSSWSPLVALALIVFIMFYSPCFVTVVCIAREAGSWRWAAFSIVFNTVLAFGLAVGVYQMGRLLGFA